LFLIKNRALGLLSYIYFRFPVAISFVHRVPYRGLFSHLKIGLTAINVA